MIWTRDFVASEDFTPPVHNPRAFPPLVLDGLIRMPNRHEQVAEGLPVLVPGRAPTWSASIVRSKRLSILQRAELEARFPQRQCVIV